MKNKAQQGYQSHYRHSVISHLLTLGPLLYPLHHAALWHLDIHVL
jgi:hypothetical protein